VITIIAFIVVLGVLIFVHEAGHFVAAKAVGVQVLRFSLGFGQPLVSWRRGETEYWISWIPLGGYVKMAGLEDEGLAGELEGGKASVAIDPARAFDRQPVWKRMIVILAGVTVNALLAFVIFSGLGVTLGEQRLAITTVDSVNVATLPEGARALATLRPGDRILRVNTDTMRTWDDIVAALLAASRDVRVAVAGRADPLELHFAPGDSVARRKTAESLFPLIPARIGIVLPGQPAARGGLRPDDLVLRMDGDTIRSWGAMLQRIWNSPGRELHLTVLRDGRVLELQVVPTPQTETDSTSPRPKTYGLIGAQRGDPPTVRHPIPLTRAVAQGAEETVLQSVAVVVAVKRLIYREGSLRDVGGVIFIAQMSGQAARLGVARFLSVLAIFSVSLAVLNLLPIPVLDGGHALFLVAEAVRRKPLPLELRLRLTQVGFVVILGLMLLGIANDLVRGFAR
jgi:regulator of sigma E protease